MFGGEAKLWDVETGQEIRSFGGGGAVAFSPDGTRVLTGEDADQLPRGEARLWDVETGQEIRSFGGGLTNSVAFSPDGKWVLTGNEDGTARIRQNVPRSLIYVDDDASEDPGPGDPQVSDPLENGDQTHPMDSIQEAIDWPWTEDGSTILVHEGVYNESVDFRGKAITIVGLDGAPIIEVPQQDAFTFHTGEGADSVLKNFIIRNSGMGISLNYGSSPRIRNLTLVDNDFGIAAYEDSDPDISNCILWNNRDGDLFQCQARYSCIESDAAGTGNIGLDPLFVDASVGDYHLKSVGWFWNTITLSWAYYEHATSPCIDAGDPDSPLGNELLSIARDPYNEWGENLRINMGAYGGTSQASMPPLGWTPREGEE